MNSHVDRVKGKFVPGPKEWESILEEPKVAKWYDRLASRGTKLTYLPTLYRFLNQAGLRANEFLGLSPKAARDAIWEVAEDHIHKNQVAYASMLVAALRHFYRFHNEQKLEFDSRKGGRHYIPVKRKRVGFEIIPERNQVYTLADSTIKWRNKAVILTLFQSGIRVSALCNLNYGMVADQLNRVPIRLKITSSVDTKMQGMDIDYYYTFLGKEAIEAINRYIKWEEARDFKFEKDTPLFRSTSGKRIVPSVVRAIVKHTAANAGLDPKTIWPHCLRKAFRKVLNASPMDEDTKEAIMGHKLPGVRGNYFDLHDIDEIEQKYARCNFSRSELQPVSQLDLLRQFAKTIGIAPDKVTIHKNIATVEDEIALYEKMIRARLGIKAAPGELEKPEEWEQLGPVYESTVIKEKDLPAYLKKGWEFVSTLNNKGTVVIKRKIKPKSTK